MSANKIGLKMINTFRKKGSKDVHLAVAGALIGPSEKQKTLNIKVKDEIVCTLMADRDGRFSNIVNLGKISNHDARSKIYFEYDGDVRNYGIGNPINVFFVSKKMSLPNKPRNVIRDVFGPGFYNKAETDDNENIESERGKTNDFEKEVFEDVIDDVKSAMGIDENNEEAGFSGSYDESFNSTGGGIDRDGFTFNDFNKIFDVSEGLSVEESNELILQQIEEILENVDIDLETLSLRAKTYRDNLDIKKEMEEMLKDEKNIIRIVKIRVIRRKAINRLYDNYSKYYPFYKAYLEILELKNRLQS